MGRRKGYDPNQMLLDLKFKKKFDTFIEATREITESVTNEESKYIEKNDLSACFAIAEAIKESIRKAGFSREQMVDHINDYFCRTEEGAAEEPPFCLKPLTIHQFNNYLSKPIKYRIPAYYVFAVMAITDSLDVARVFVAPFGGQVITADEARDLKVAKIMKFEEEAKRLKKELKDMKIY